MDDNYKLLKECKGILTKQQYKTLKGQIKSGDIQGFRKGLFNLMLRKGIKRN